MAKQGGLGANLWLGAYNLSGDTGAVDTISSPRGTQTVTGLTVLAHERILTTRDGALAFTGYWNPTAGQIVDVLNNMPTTDLLSSLAIPATPTALVVGDAACAMAGKQITFDNSRGQDGALVVSTSLQANGTALEWGQLLTTGQQTFASGTLNGTSINYGSTSTLFGAAAYLHVISLGSGTPTVTIADSANDSTFVAISGLAFTPTAAYAERLQTGLTATIRQYVRVQVSGTYTNLVCALVFVRYETSQAV